LKRKINEKGSITRKTDERKTDRNEVGNKKRERERKEKEQERGKGSRKKKRKTKKR
jgi:hypothetical protein